ncbi:MAG TPA: GDSL-type esterase/lipase family protein [Candidatus Sulfotelmatobacter sp.]|nr:GDSL-type esterase/lipase family protein [Candidatus Sulfotelmatobacter sp.]
MTTNLRKRFLPIAFLLIIVPITALSAQSALNPAIVPADRMSEKWWADRHNAILQQIHTHSDTGLVLIGDSITNNYDKANPPDENFQPTWNEFYAPRKALNLGFSGDTTSHVLWRLDHGEVDGIHPKVAIVLIGTNNTGHGQTAEQTEIGIDAVVNRIEELLPETHVLLLGILPSDRSDDKTSRDRAINSYLATCYGENPRVTYLDIGSIFEKDGAINSSIFYDPRLPGHPKPLHPDTNGQRMMAEAIEPTLARLMGDTPRHPLAAMTDINTALIPVSRLEQDLYDWFARHHAELDLQKRMRPDVVMIGDSITHFWSGPPEATVKNGPAAWQSLFKGMSVLNMGFGWDRTQNVLWRLRQDEFEGLHPRWVVVEIGTNNLTGTENARASTPQEIADAIGTICDEVRRRSPESHIVVMGIFPRGAKTDDPLRGPIAQTNQLLSQKFAQSSAITFLDIGKRFLAPDGMLPVSLMPDGTHPSDKGYQIWAEALIEAGIRP